MSLECRRFEVEGRRGLPRETELMIREGMALEEKEPEAGCKATL